MLGPLPRSASMTALCLASIAGCTRPVPPAPPASPPPVTVATARVQTVPVQLRAIGTVRVFATVAVRPRLNGELTEVHFREGQDVKKGDRLFTIDPRPYRTALEQAKAQLERDQALLRGAELVLERGRQLARTSAIAAELLDRNYTDVASARATVAADQAAVKSAELQLEFTTINAPIDGRTGNVLVTVGNLVSTSEPNPLVVINQISPISVSFSVPEQYLAEIEANRRKHDGTLPVDASLRGGSAPLHGKLTFIDNTANTTTGTVQLKATFPNEDRRLWPGQFVEVIMTLGERRDSVTVPSAAVQEGQDGSFVFVLRPDSTAALQFVDTAFVTTEGEAVITKGLSGGETVITDGHLRVAPGSKVAVQATAKSDKQP
jgi:multidrug efflux system membrane fusion protein